MKNSKDKDKLNIIINDLEKFRKRITKIDYIHDKGNFLEVMKKFRKHIAGLDSDMFNLLYHSKYYKFYNEFFTSTHEYYLRSLESMQSLSVMTKGIHNYDSFSGILDRELLKESFQRKFQELEPIDFTNAKNFVFAGCGPFPETILFVYENTKIKNILGLDFNHEAIYMAGEMINGLGLDKISFKQIDATEYDYSNADIVSIPLFVPKKSEVINQIIETGKDGVQIMVTCPKGFMNIIYKGIGNNITPRAKITYRKDIVSDYVNEEIIKIEKYDF